MADDMITIQLVNGENYIGRGYHFRKGDTAEMSKKDARPFLQIEAGAGKKKFSIYDPDMGLGLPVEETEPEPEPEPEPEAVKIAVDPRLMTEPKDLRQWLVDHGIEVAPNATMAKMTDLLPENIAEILAEDAGIESDDEVTV